MPFCRSIRRYVSSYMQPQLHMWSWHDVAGTVRFPDCGNGVKTFARDFAMDSKWAAVSKRPRCRWDVKHNQLNNYI